MRGISEIADPVVAHEFVAQLGLDLQDESCPEGPVARPKAAPLARSDHQLAPRKGDGPTEAINNLIKRIKRIKRIGFGFRRLPNHRIRALLYAGRPNWDLLATVEPR